MISVFRIRNCRRSSVRRPGNCHSYCIYFRPFRRKWPRSDWVVFPNRSHRIRDIRQANRNGKGAIQNPPRNRDSDSGISAWQNTFTVEIFEKAYYIIDTIYNIAPKTGVVKWPDAKNFLTA